MRKVTRQFISKKSFQTLVVPGDAQPLKVMMRPDHIGDPQPMLYLIVDEPGSGSERWTILSVPTLQELPARCSRENYIGTVEDALNEWSIFIVKRESV